MVLVVPSLYLIKRTESVEEICSSRIIRVDTEQRRFIAEELATAKSNEFEEVEEVHECVPCSTPAVENINYKEKYEHLLQQHERLN